MNSEPILGFLEEMTGIKGLISDPTYNGGGCTKLPPAVIGRACDFRILEPWRLQRAMNLLIYLNRIGSRNGRSLGCGTLKSK